MSHVILSTQPGEGPGGSVEITIRYTPSHDVPRAEQIRRIEWATRKAEKIADKLYTSAVPLPDED